MEINLDEALSTMILSASGWRGVFAVPPGCAESGDEESATPEISLEHKIIVSLAARAFSAYINAVAPGKNAVIVGRDTRPTGEAIAEVVLQTLLAEGREVRYTGVSAIPEIMAYVRNCHTKTAGFIYISASHNPIGHNGIKFGLTDGGVLQAEEAEKLVSAFHTLASAPDKVMLTREFLEEMSEVQLDEVYKASEKWKKAALTAYWSFTGEVISGFGGKVRQEEFFSALRRGLEKRPLGVAVDFNGSARTVSIDKGFFVSLGAGFFVINEKPGEIVHRIVPEGESLNECRCFLEMLHRKDPSVILGYMPDCDGDRGNMVIWDEGAGHARILEAQEVFALACISELSYQVWTGEFQYDSGGKVLLTKAAVAVNDPTSLRIDRIAGAFGASVFRAEVGEANVVGLARKLRKDGYLVRMLGEGSSGGTIVYPSAVRDPINTLGSILKLLAIREGKEKGRMGLFEIWCAFSGQAEIYSDDFTLADIIASLPDFASTGAYSNDAIIKVKTADHCLLKEKYQKIFLKEWEEKKSMLEELYGFSSWEAIAYNGITEKRGINSFGDAGRGGLKIEFFDRQGADTGAAKACIWMRGSGTEPVFRVMADAEGFGSDTERFLIGWQRSMVMKADDSANTPAGGA